MGGKNQHKDCALEAAASHWQGVFRSSKPYINHHHDTVTSNMKTPWIARDNQNEKSKFSPKLSLLTFNCNTVDHKLPLDTNGRYLLSFSEKFWCFYHFILQLRIDK